MDDLGLFASILGHIGDGNFHESIMYNSKDPKERAAVEKCIKDMVDRALEMEGTCTGEHGVGLGKKDSLLKELGLDTINVMKSIKGTFLLFNKSHIGLLTNVTRRTGSALVDESRKNHGHAGLIVFGWTCRLIVACLCWLFVLDCVSLLFTKYCIERGRLLSFRP